MQDQYQFSQPSNYQQKQPQQGYYNNQEGFPTQNFYNNSYQNQADFEKPAQKLTTKTSSKYDDVQDMNCNLGFKPIHSRFIQKVLSVVGLQLLLTCFIIMISTFSMSFRQFQYENIWLVVVCVIFNIGTLYTLYCYRESSRRHPMNIILLLLFTVTEGYLMSFLCNAVSPGIVLLTGLLCFGLVAILALYAIRQRAQINVCRTVMIFLPLAILAIIISSAAYPAYISHTIMSLFIVLLFSTYLVYDIQRLVHKGDYSYDLDEYIIAALDIYIDVIIIFKELLSVLGRGSR